MVATFVIAALVSATDSVNRKADTPQNAIRSFYRALSAEDERAYSRLTSNRFYAFDVGKRFVGRELHDAIHALHAQGRIAEWNLGPIDVHVRGTMAWAAWENHGAVGTASSPQPMSWLESAVLHRSARGWVLEFLHSTRSGEPAAEKKP